MLARASQSAGTMLKERCNFLSSGSLASRKPVQVRTLKGLVSRFAYGGWDCRRRCNFGHDRHEAQLVKDQGSSAVMRAASR